MEELHAAFDGRWGTPNNKTRSDYGRRPDDSTQNRIDSEFSTEIPTELIQKAIRGINNDTSPGTDNITIRTLKNVDCTKIIASIISIMLNKNYVPEKFKEARTILTPKKGDLTSPSNWRPISICSIIRRVVERVLDQVTKRYTSTSEHQRGFTNQPGTHINTSLIAACLKKAKQKKMDASIVFLDIVKAFDMI